MCVCCEILTFKTKLNIVLMFLILLLYLIEYHKKIKLIALGRSHIKVEKQHMNMIYLYIQRKIIY